MKPLDMAGAVETCIVNECDKPISHEIDVYSAVVGWVHVGVCEHHYFRCLNPPICYSSSAGPFLRYNYVNGSQGFRSAALDVSSCQVKGHNAESVCLERWYLSGVGFTMWLRLCLSHNAEALKRLRGESA